MGRDRGSGHPLENYENKGFPSITGPDRLNNHKATKSAFIFGPSSAFRWRAGDGPLIVVFVCTLSLLKHRQSWIPSGKTFWIRAYHGFIDGELNKIFH